MAYFLKIVLCSTAFLMLSFGWTGCASGKSSKSSNAAEAMEAPASSELEEAKQSAEAAEWEAHRLREELYRKKNAKKSAE